MSPFFLKLICDGNFFIDSGYLAGGQSGMIRKLPIGLQDFEGLIKDGFLYIDKTEYIYNLVSKGKVYFLSRPRRFGKSLLLSTLKAFFEGKKGVV